MVGRRCFVAGLIAVFVGGLPAAVPAGAQGQGPERLSAGNGTWSGNPVMSPNGRYVAFDSDATDLVSPREDTNGAGDVFLYDRESDDLTLVSVSSSGDQANSSSYVGSVSNDGDVAFTSTADNLFPGDASVDNFDVFVHDLSSGQTERIGLALVDPWWSSAGNSSPMISADGNLVAFSSFVPGTEVWSNSNELHLYNRSSDNTTVVVDSSHGVGSLDLSADGSTIAFETYATLRPADTDNYTDVYLYDVSSVAFRLASVDDRSEWHAITPSLSSDGQHVAFQWHDCIINPSGYGCTSYEAEIRVFDRQLGQTTRVSVDRNGNQPVGNFGKPAISGNGRYVSFASDVSTLVTDPDTNGRLDVFVRDRQDHETTLVSVSATGEEGDEESGVSAVSSDGTIVFDSYASNLVAGDAAWTADVFLVEP